MSRDRRKKADNGIYHIMVRSISEIHSFQNNKDKEIYLDYVKHYQEIFKFKVYAYCVMTNHAHLMIDSNGADISKIMQGINLKYASYYNKKHNRHGHLFQDRFKSKLVQTEKYLVTLSGYIHNNPLKIKGYENCPEKYKYSSLSVYLGIKKDFTNLIDEDYIMSKFDIKAKEAREKYLKFVYLCDDERLKEEMEFQNEKTEYRSGRTLLVRNLGPEKIMDYITSETGIEKIMMYMKNNRKSRIARALAALLMRCLCDYRIKDICKVMGNVTQSTVSCMCNFAVKKISEEQEYRDIVNKFINRYVNVQLAT